MIYGEKFRQARELCGLTQVDLAEKVGVHQSMIALLEREARTPTEDLIERISAATGFPTEFFTESGGPDFPLGSLMFRKHSKLGSQEKAKSHRMAQQAYRMVETMTTRLKLHPLRFPREFQEDAESAAQLVRNGMGCDPTTPIPNLINRLETGGILVFQLPDEVPDLDGFSTWVDNTPIIAITAGKSGDRQRMTVAHECGHLILHRSSRGGFDEMEREANRFASELLLPEAAMRVELTTPVTLSGLAELKKRWGASIQHLIYRAGDLGIINPNQVRYLFMEVSKRGWRKAEPVHIPAEKPRALRKMAETLYGDPINYRKLAKDARLPLFWTKRIVESHAGKHDTSKPTKASESITVPFAR